MPFGPEAHTARLKYEVELLHVPSGLRLNLMVEPFALAPLVPTEAQKDALFQGFLNKLAEIPNAQIVSAVKMGQFSATVTPA